MLYQEYKSKILKRVALRKAIRRFRVPIIAMLATVVILLSAFFIVKGTVGDITPGQEFNGDKIEYGKAPTFSAEAWFSDVRYEYSDAKGTAWSSKAPTHMGNYKVRAVSEGFFGERYSEEMAFSIVPRTIEVSLKDKTVVYGESPRVTASLAFKDKIICSEFVFDDTTQQQTQVQPVKGSVVILDENGNDVTGCYIINTKKENVTFTKRDITVTVESKEQVYDGTAHKHEVWQVTGGSLAYGDDVVKIVEGSFSSIIGAGSTENKGQFRVWRGDGENAVDITHHYNVTLVAGTLTITQKPIVILPSGGEYVYDGKAHYETGFTVDPSTPLVGGHTISVKDYPVITDVGEIENLLVMLIQKGDGSEVTDNYCFTYAGDYLLKVLPRELSATTESATATYDGQDHTFEGVLDIDGIADGHSIVVTNATVIKNVEKLENKLEIKDTINV